MRSRSRSGSCIEARWLTWPATLNTTSAPRDGVGRTSSVTDVGDEDLDVDARREAVEVARIATVLGHQGVDDDDGGARPAQAVDDVGADEPEPTGDDAPLPRELAVDGCEHVAVGVRMIGHGRARRSKGCRQLAVNDRHDAIWPFAPQD